MKQADGLGNVLSSSRNAENVTSSYTDYEARLSSLNTQEERLLAMLEKSKNLEILPQSITIRSAMTEENRAQIAELAQALSK